MLELVRVFRQFGVGIPVQVSFQIGNHKYIATPQFGVSFMSKLLISQSELQWFKT